MHYDISYRGLTRAEAFEKAVHDAVDYNPKGVITLVQLMRNTWKPRASITEIRQWINTFRLGAEFAGVRGLPVRALMRQSVYG